MPAPDFDAISDALAARFAGGVATPAAPGGETDVRLSSAEPGNVMGPLPCVFVWVESGQVTVQGGQTRMMVSRLRVRFYLDLASDEGRVESRLKAWLTVLVQRLKVATTLSSTVERAIVREWRMGRIRFGDGEQYDGIELLVDVTTNEPWAAA